MCAYFSNGSEGSILDGQCFNCPVGSDPDQPCPVLSVQAEWNYKQFNKHGKKNEIAKILDQLVDYKGTCLMRKAILDAKPKGQMIIDSESHCPDCGGQDFNLEHFRPSSAAGEHWIRSCAACGHEFTETLK